MTNDYYRITTTYASGKPIKVELTDSRYDLRVRPASTHLTKVFGTPVDIYYDWYTADEIRRDFPEIAKDYAF